MNISTLLDVLQTETVATSDADVQCAAAEYVAAGLSVIPIARDGSKRPAWQYLPSHIDQMGIKRRPWKPYQSRLPTAEEIRSWFATWGPPPGIAVVTGAVSGGLECIDFDDAAIFYPWFEQLQAEAPSILDRLVYVRSPRPGVHVYFRSGVPGRNTKLAEELVLTTANPVCVHKTLIETRAEAGYVLVPPSPSACHPTGRNYGYITPRTLCNVEFLSDSERELLLLSARRLTRVIPPAVRSPLPSEHRQTIRNRDRPGDDYDERVDWHHLLTRYGWIYAALGANGEEHWRRPGKSEGTSATLNFNNSKLLHVFSTNAAPLESGRSYTPFQFLTLMQYGGNFVRASAALRAAGYGQQPQLWRGRSRRRG